MAKRFYYTRRKSQNKNRNKLQQKNVWAPCLGNENNNNNSSSSWLQQWQWATEAAPAKKFSVSLWQSSDDVIVSVRSESTGIQLRYLHLWLSLPFFPLSFYRILVVLCVCCWFFPSSFFYFLTFYLTKRLQRGKKVYAILGVYCCTQTLVHTIPVFWLCWFRFSAISIGWRRIHTVRSCYFIIVHVNSSEQNQVERRIVARARLFARVFFCVPFCSARVMRFFSHWSFVLVVDFFCSRFRSGFIKIMTVSRVSLPTKKKVIEKTIVDLQWFAAHNVV